MAGKRAVATAARRKAPQSSRTPQNSQSRSSAKAYRNIPDGFRELLEEEEALNESPVPRPIKRRRLEGSRPVLTKSTRESIENSTTLDSPLPNSQAEDDSIPQQTAFDSSDESEENFEWEDVDIDQDSFPEPTSPSDEHEVKPEAISVVLHHGLNPNASSKRKARKPLTKEERKIRLEIHKLHILCLLYHCLSRNHWCNNHQLQQSLRRMVAIPVGIVTKLHQDPSLGQYKRSQLFKEGLQAVMSSWLGSFKINERGLGRPHWRDDSSTASSSEETESFVDIGEFIEKAQTWEGSADFGAQLFCALLRAYGLETRLVCSLQIMPFAIIATVNSPIKNTGKITMYADVEESEGIDELEDSPGTPSHPTRPGRIGRLGQRKIGLPPAPRKTQPPPRKRSRHVSRPRHPVFWVEVFDAAYQKWIPVDPIATGTVGKTTSLEPALNDPSNLLSYVIAFEESGAAKDVTRRYTKAYIAKTRKIRVEVVEKGDRWFTKVLKLFRKRRLLNRDHLEEAQLYQREYSEGMPKNIEDFKGHPIYVLERHLHRDQVLHPKKQVGRINAGPKSAAKIEYVYRRQDVHSVKSSDKWFRLGRQLKIGENPLKRVMARKVRALSADGEIPAVAIETVGMYSISQTELYVPPAVIDGRIPRNQFGNIDVYVRTMIPPGAVHIKSKHARKAARIIDVSYADAVTGFKFQGRHGTAILQGVVVAAEHRDAMVEVLNGLAYERELTLEAWKRQEAIVLWRRFFRGLEIVERLKQYREFEDEHADDSNDIQEALNQEIEDEEPLQLLDEDALLDTDVIQVIEPLVISTTLQKGSVQSSQDRKTDESVEDMGEVESHLNEMELDALFEEDIALAQQQSLEILEAEDAVEAVVQNVAQLEHNVDSDTWEENSLISEDPDDLDAEPDWI